MVFGKLPMPGRPTNLDDSRARAYCACNRCGWGCFAIFTLLLSFLLFLPLSGGGGGRVVRRCWVNFQCRGVLLIWIIVGQGSIAFAVRAGGGCLDIFSLIYHFSFLSPSLWETARYKLKYCLKGPLSPKNQPTNHPSLWETARYRYGWLVGCFGLSGPLRQYFSLYMVGWLVVLG